MLTLPLTPLQPTQFDAATELLCEAFAADPMFNYLVPADVPHRQDLMQALFRMLLLCGSGAEQSYTLVDPGTQALKGVMIWMPPGQSVGLLNALWAGLYQLPFACPGATCPVGYRLCISTNCIIRLCPSPTGISCCWPLAPPTSARALAIS
ncbi:MAG: hypothetical protein HC929_23140 [Leptolyngbyaceae cyanobacterium SM2_5_2]|nr:hypothetical protein [Leptolyngbyaceae cyanobacterium SM2_5_2]